MVGVRVSFRIGLKIVIGGKCQGGNCSRGNCPTGNCPRSDCPRGDFSRVNCSRLIVVWGNFSSCNSPRC